MRRAGLVAACCALALASATRADEVVAPAAAATEHWFEMRIAGVPAGYVHEQLDAADPTALHTTVESALVLNRLDARVEISDRAVTVEDRDGHLRSLHFEMRASKDTTALDVTVRDGMLAIATEAGGRSYRREQPNTRVLLGPEGIRALTAERLAAGAGTFRYATFVPELAAVAVATRRVTGRAPPSSGGPALAVVEETMDALPTPARLLVAPDGRVVEESEDGPFGVTTLVPATAAVRDLLVQSGSPAADVYVHSLVRANVRLPEPRAIERLRVRLDLRTPGDLPALDGPFQRVLERASDHVVLEVRRARVGADRPAPPREAARYTQPNFILQSDHPDVAALAATLRRPGAGPYAQARLLQDWVARNMRFDAGLALVPASEAVRDRGGSCVAYAVLLASLARALGIPARIVMGYVYIANVFAGHAWTEIEVGGRWIPLDAAVYRAGPADAARIALVRHSAEQGAASGATVLTRVFGNESIRILGYGIGGDWVDVPASAAAYVIRDGRYRNPWLGLSVRGPEGLEFARADAAYPDTTVIALAAPDGGEIRLRQLGLPGPGPGTGPRGWLASRGYAADAGRFRVAGREAERGSGALRAAYVFRDGEDLWLLEADGASAVQRLDAVAAGVQLVRPHGVRAALEAAGAGP